MTDSPSSHRSRRVARVAMEALFAIVLVFACFTGFLSILARSFPGGTRLRDVLGRRTAVISEHSPATRAMAFLAEGDGSMVALVQSIRRGVKTREAGSLVWTTARPNQKLGDRDAVQTLSHSSATLVFGKVSRLDIGENSLVVLRHAEIAGGEVPRTRVVAMRGELRGQVASARGDWDGVEIETAGGASVVPLAGATGAQVRIVTHPDGGASIMAYDGGVEVRTPRNRVTLPARHYMVVDSAAASRAVRPLPGVPTVLEPAEGASIRIRRPRGSLRFVWTRPAGADAFHVVLARDAAFTDVVYEKRTPSTTFVHSKLPAGGYYFRVSAVAGEIEGPFAATRLATLVRDGEGPYLAVDFPREVVTAERMVLYGETEPGSTVRIADQTVAIKPDGTFRATVRLEPGANLVVVQVIDAAGNVTYASKTVTARY